MSEAKQTFTPGPWRAITTNFVDGVEITADSRNGMVSICIVPYAYIDGEHQNDFEREQAENAALIAAAPETAAECDRLKAVNAELVELLKPIVKAADEILNNGEELEAEALEWLKIAKAEIAKATGDKQ